MKIGDRPAAVIGDEIREKPLSRNRGWEGAESRVNRKSEDLPDMRCVGVMIAGAPEYILRIKGTSRIGLVVGPVFLFEMVKHES